jgi:oxalate decarboxylase/phosphoglucose isomerase-like protein (cupin superfamily)
MKKTTKIIDLPKIADHRGNLTFIEGHRHIPFPIRRAYYLYDVPAGATRGGHAHKTVEEFIIAASGSFTVVIDDGKKRKKYFLNRPHYGLYIPNLAWRELENFSTGSICLVLASEEYEESDYYRNYRKFKAALKAQRNGAISRSASRLPRTKK